MAKITREKMLADFKNYEEAFYTDYTEDAKEIYEKCCNDNGTPEKIKLWTGRADTDRPLYVEEVMIEYRAQSPEELELCHTQMPFD